MGYIGDAMRINQNSVAALRKLNSQIMKSTWLMVYIVSINMLLSGIGTFAIADGFRWAPSFSFFLAFTVVAVADLFIGLTIFNAVQQSTAWSKGFLTSSWIAALVAGVTFSLPFLFRFILYPFI